MDITWTVSSMAQLAVLLEVSAPKPGNVNRGADFSDTGYRHFLASAALMGEGIYTAAQRGVAVSRGELSASDVRAGQTILDITKAVCGGIVSKNTVFGTVLLYVPLAVAMAATIERNCGVDPEAVSTTVDTILSATTVQDTLDLFVALRLVAPRGEMNKQVPDWSDHHDRYDIYNPEVFENITTDRLTLDRLLRESSSVDRICRELSTRYRTVLFEIVPRLRERMSGVDNAEEAIVDVFLWQLAREPDWHIVRRAGLEQAQEVTRRAAQIVEGEGTALDSLRRLDALLRSNGNLLNPGTTADLVSAGVFYRLVELALNNQ